jgi:hypothetical protein
VYNVFKDEADSLKRAVRAALAAPLLDRCVAVIIVVVIAPRADG